MDTVRTFYRAGEYSRARGAASLTPERWRRVDKLDSKGANQPAVDAVIIQRCAADSERLGIQERDLPAERAFDRTCSYSRVDPVTCPLLSATPSNEALRSRKADETEQMGVGEGTIQRVGADLLFDIVVTPIEQLLQNQHRNHGGHRRSSA
jgi:hypothetical protein